MPEGGGDARMGERNRMGEGHVDRVSRIRFYRRLRGLTQAELGRRAGLSDSAVRNYELGKRTPGTAQLEALAEALAVPTAALLDWVVETPREAMELLYRLEESFGLVPLADGTLSFPADDDRSAELRDCISAWCVARAARDAGECTQDGYDIWRAEHQAG